MALVLYKHNLETYRCILEKFKSSNRVCFVQPTGTGKTFVYLNWIKDNPGRSVYVLAPSTEIFSQMKSYALGSGCSEILANVQFVTYQGLFRMSPEMRQKIRASMLILDEFHRIGAEQWGDCVLQLLRANNRALVLGGTATPVRYLDNGRDMIQELFNGVCARYMTLGEAVHTGVLPEPVYVPVWYDVDGFLPEIESKISNFKSDKMRAEVRVLYDKLRGNLQNSFGASEVFQKVLGRSSGKLIVFCKTIEHIYAMIPLVKGWLRGVAPCIHTYISVSVSDGANSQLSAFREDTSMDTLKLLFTVDRFNEGLHIQDIDGVIMLRPTASPIVFLQQLGRALGSGCRRPFVFDFVNNYRNVHVLSDFEDCLDLNVFEKEILDSVRLWGGPDASEDLVFRLFERATTFNSILDELSLLTAYNIHWDDILGVVKEFLNEFGRWPAGNDIYKGICVGTWCKKQRSYFRSGGLDESRVEKLLAPGFDFEPFDTVWLSWYNLLKDFLKEFGRWPFKDEVYRGKQLGSWYFRQRQLIKRGGYSRSKFELLDKLGIDLSNKKVESQERHLAELRKFIQATGKFPTKDFVVDNVPVGQWAGVILREAVKKDNPVGVHKAVLDLAKSVNRVVTPRWSAAEDEILRMYFPVEGGKVSLRLPGRSVDACIQRATKVLKLEYFKVPFSDIEDNVIRANWEALGVKTADLLPGRIGREVSVRARELGFCGSLPAKEWSAEENARLVRFYPTDGQACFVMFPNRTARACVNQVRRLGLVSKASRGRVKGSAVARWTQEEIDMLVYWYPIEGQRCFVRFPNRTPSACASMVSKLGLKKVGVV